MVALRMHTMVARWLVGWSVGRSDSGRLLLRRLIGRLVRQSIGWLAGPASVGRLIGWSVD